MNNEPNSEQYRNLQNLANNISRQIKLLEVIRAALEQALSQSEVSDSFYQLFSQDKANNKLRMQFYRRLLRLHRFILDVNVLKDSSLKDQSNAEDVPGEYFQNLPLKAKEFSPNNPNEWLSKNQISSIFTKLKKKIAKLSNHNYLKRNIWTNPQFNYNHKKPEAFVTSLRQIELATEALIKVSQLNNWQDLLTAISEILEN